MTTATMLTAIAIVAPFDKEFEEATPFFEAPLETEVEELELEVVVEICCVVDDVPVVEVVD